MSVDRVTHIVIEGFKAFRDEVTLRIDELAVLIGENGSGKSSLLQAVEILHQAAKPGNFTEDLLRAIHGLPDELINEHCRFFSLGIRIEGAGAPLEYRVWVAASRNRFLIDREVLTLFERGDDNPLIALERREKFRFFDVKDRRLTSFEDIDPGQLALSSFGISAQPAIGRMLEALSSIQCHAPFLARPLWQQHELGMREGPRWPALVEPTARLQRFGLNLANCYQQLKNASDPTVWERILMRCQLGLGQDIRDIRLFSLGRGQVDLEIVYARPGSRPRPLSCLSDGQVSYLCLVAMSELLSPCSLLCLDEPELHLHPGLVSRVVAILESIGKQVPVLVATHSNQLLDALQEPSSSVFLCRQVDSGIELRQPTSALLSDWMADYQGLGSIRAAGYEAHVFESVTVE